MAPRPATEFTREVSALDRLAADAGVAGKSGVASTIRPRRSYKDRLEVRPEGRPAQTSTRFALPRRAPGSSPSRRPGTQTKGPGQGPVRRQTRAQEEEETRRAAVEARKAAARPQPVAYSYEGLDEASFSPVLDTLRKNGSSTAYSRFTNLTQDERDPVRLVAGNRSILHKKTVLKKIDTWIPPPPPAAAAASSAAQESRA
ncbi:protein of unknown function [Taphrina deformans PYCC 5710]|uniref:Uncharacterized protein n=1 Tax=Taphrina deformans (strain PYCC 5710 / ATCC 11124 / CBS 356.35 / IMI 108563 / JCM 9778 / NBRC 8474) TaxID=1097556 RepID=R4XD77_TAPDE|nr:protein of unknown function [Taphrina deformans PYCC 5710]|eukprot:CCG83780.1 protein of unknown function [Taphrina deformans PYCC 5710]